MKILWAFGLFFSFICCGQNSGTVFPLNFEKDLIPEGIAIDSISKKVYVNSLKSAKIVRCNLDGSNAETFLESGGFGYLSGFGMTLHGNILYALGNGLPKDNNSSILLMLDKKSGERIASYTLNNGNFVYLNDLAVDSKGTVFITDSENNAIYTIDPATNELTVFFADDEVKNPNGITISHDDRYLYLATYTTGIRILDIAQKKLINQPNTFKGIDGMKYHRNHLYGIVNTRRDPSLNGVFEFELNEKGTKIISDSKVSGFQDLSDIPTTFALYYDSIIFVADTQLDNFDQEKNTIINPDALNIYSLVHLKIP